MGRMAEIAMEYGSLENYSNTMNAYDRIQKRRAKKLLSTDKILITLVKADSFAGKYVFSKVTRLFAKEDKYEVGDVLPLYLNSSSVEFYCVQQVEIISKNDKNEYYNKKLLFIEYLIRQPEKNRCVYLNFSDYDHEGVYSCDIRDEGWENSICLNDDETIVLPNEYNDKKIRYLEINAPLSCKKLVLPKYIKSLQCDGFMLSKLETISFPKELREVSRCCFYGCIRLKEISINKQCNYLGEDCFDIFVTPYYEEIVRRYLKEYTNETIVKYDGTLEEWEKIDFDSEMSNPLKIKGLKKFVHK